MYQIFRDMDGKYHCAGRLQDGTERWTCNTLDEAVQSLKDFARAANGDTIKRKQISYYEERPIRATEYHQLPIPKKK